MRGRFYLDEDVPRQWTFELRNAGHDAVYARDIGAYGRSDGHHLFTASADNRVMIVYNRSDYSLLHDALHRWKVRFVSPLQPVHGGILCFPQHPRLAPGEFAQAISVFLALALSIEEK